MLEWTVDICNIASLKCSKNGKNCPETNVLYGCVTQADIDIASQLITLMHALLASWFWLGVFCI